MIYYTYIWLRADRTPYYVGKGRDRRAYFSCKRHRPPKDRSRIVVQYWPDESTALAMERYLIHFWGRKNNGTGILRNLTDGGENPPVIRVITWGKKISAARMGHFVSEETKQKQRDSKLAKPTRYWLGKNIPQSTKDAVSRANSGRKHTDEFKENLRLRMMGNKYQLGIRKCQEKL